MTTIRSGFLMRHLWSLSDTVVFVLVTLYVMFMTLVKENNKWLRISLSWAFLIPNAGYIDDTVVYLAEGRESGTPSFLSAS